jgi:hypothetical protein
LLPEDDMVANDVYGDMSPLTSLAAASPSPATSSVPAPAESWTQSICSTGYLFREQIPFNAATPSLEMTARIQHTIWSSTHPRCIENPYSVQLYIKPQITVGNVQVDKGEIKLQMIDANDILHDLVTARTAPGGVIATHPVQPGISWSRPGI